MDSDDNSGKSKNKSNDWCILKNMLAVFADELEVACEAYNGIKVLNWAIRRIDFCKKKVI